MSNAGLRLREPVIGDEFDMQTYGRPSSRDEQETRRRPAPRKAAPRARRAPAQQAGVYDSGRTRIDADGVRTVKIRGQATPARRRAQTLTRYDQHPDRAAQWALFLGVFMVVVAIVTGT
ncbi:MAG: hypothetical protein ACRDKI_06410 [Solirubrobacterales bacterium]